jgi:hypothetical protein
VHEATGNERRPSSTARALAVGKHDLLPRAYVPNRVAEHSGLIVLSLNGLSLTDISAGAEPRCIMLAVERVSMFSMRDTHDRRPELAHGI